MAEKYWEVKQVNKSLDGKEILSVELRDKIDNASKVTLKWDGCIDIRKYYNGYTADAEWSQDMEENSDYIHLCDINVAIERLKEIQKIMSSYTSLSNSTHD